MRRDDEYYGNGILSRYRLTFRRAIELPGRSPFFCGENRAAIEVTIETDLGKIHIINTHLGLGWRERFVQTQLFTSAEWRAASPVTRRLFYRRLQQSAGFATISHAQPASARCARTNSNRLNPFALFRRDFRCWLSITFSSTARSSH